MGLLLFKKQFADDIRSGRKRTTLRRWNRARVQAGGRAFCPGLGWLKIETVERIKLSDLRKSDAQADGFESLREMRETLKAIYPDTKDGKCWWRVRFRLEAE